jgi:DNA-binding LacI/PurR family transcriptional regulator
MTAKRNDDTAQTAPQRRVTLADVANICGVSKITVSRALRNSPQVRPDVRDRIHAAAQSAGYRVNVAARDLRLSNRRRVAVVVDWTPNDARPMSDPYPLALLGGVVEALATAGYAAVVTTNDPALRAEAADTSGVILLGQGADHHTVQEYSALGLPLVVWGDDDGIDRASGAAVVGSDNRHGGAEAARHFIAKGCSHCVFLGDVRHAEMQARRMGCAEALAAQGGGPLHVVRCELTTASAEVEIETLLADNPSIDGIFAGSDLMAVGAMRAATRAGRTLTIIGYDDSPTAAAYALTSVRQDWMAGGRLLAETLLAIIAGQRPTPLALPTRLIVRDT